MDATHLHLLVNHLPILGSFFALPLLVLALWRRQEPWLFAGAALLLLIGGAAGVVAEESGEGAEEAVEHLAGVSEALIHEHEERAEVATPLAVITGLAALGVAALSLRRRATWLPGGAVVLLLTGVTAGTMAWVGQSGGLIRHTELRDPSSNAGGPSTPALSGEHGERGEQEDDD
jgi:peptidoglycan/LPS O-acetylase OafA/YrhL